jgi:uncharacterized protein involved in exopolysaccharide biosynthesis
MFEPRDPTRMTPRPPDKGGGLAVSTNGGDETHILDRLSSIYRHRRLVVSLFSVVVLLMMLQSYATIPLYRATARLLIEEEQSVMVSGMDSSDPVNYWTGSEPYYETQYRILQSPGLTRYTIAKLDLGQVPEFNGEAKQQFGPVGALRATRSVVVGRAKTVGTTLLGIIRPDAAIQVATPPAPEPTQSSS